MPVTTPLDTPAPTAVAIKRLLRARLGRQWRVGDRLPPVKELARQLGTGQSNTHQAVRQLAAEGLLESRQRRGTYVLRTPQTSATHTVGDAQRGRLAGRILTIFTAAELEGFVARMVDAFSDVMSSTGIELRHQHIPHSMNNQPHTPLKADGDAMVLFNPGSRVPLNLRPEQLLTIVSTAARMQVERTQRYDLVSVDELHGGSLAGNVLRAAGCKQACYLGRGMPPQNTRPDATSALRLYGFEAAWTRSVEPQHMLMAQGYSPLAGGKLYRRYRELKGEKPDGIFAASDDLAIGFIAAAAADGLAAGADYQIVGFDGQDRGQFMGDTSLTTVKAPASEMGRRAAQLLIERFAEPDRPVHRLQLECALHRGTTTHIPS